MNELFCPHHGLLRPEILQTVPVVAGYVWATIQAKGLLLLGMGQTMSSLSNFFHDVLALCLGKDRV